MLSVLWHTRRRRETCDLTVTIYITDGYDLQSHCRSYSNTTDPDPLAYCYQLKEAKDRLEFHPAISLSQVSNTHIHYNYDGGIVRWQRVFDSQTGR
jgi:hypothetical protein